MNIDTLLGYDQELLLALNGSDSQFMDGLMMALTSGMTWIPLYIALLYLVIKNSETMGQIALIVACAALCVLFADGLADGIVKPGVARFRPVQRPFAARRCTDCGRLLRQWSVRLLLGACVKYVLDSRVLQSACEKWHTEYGLALVVACMLLHPYVSGRTLSV